MTCSSMSGPNWSLASPKNHWRLYLAAGEVLSRFMPIALPAPIIGLLLLFGWLIWRGTVPQALGTLADQMLGLFGLFFVPAGVGVVAYGKTLQTDFIAIALAITVGTRSPSWLAPQRPPLLPP